MKLKQSPTVTSWFPPQVKPVRVGVYETTVPNVEGTYFSKFDGVSWLRDKYSAESAHNQTSESYCQNRHWRGLTKKP